MAPGLASAQGGGWLPAADGRANESDKFGLHALDALSTSSSTSQREQLLELGAEQAVDDWSIRLNQKPYLSFFVKPGFADLGSNPLAQPGASPAMQFSGEEPVEGLDAGQAEQLGLLSLDPSSHGGAAPPLPAHWQLTSSGQGIHTGGMGMQQAAANAPQQLNPGRQPAAHLQQGVMASAGMHGQGLQGYPGAAAGVSGAHMPRMLPNGQADRLAAQQQMQQAAWQPMATGGAAPGGNNSLLHYMAPSVPEYVTAGELQHGGVGVMDGLGGAGVEVLDPSADPSQVQLLSALQAMGIGGHGGEQAGLQPGYGSGLEYAPHAMQPHHAQQEMLVAEGLDAWGMPVYQQQAAMQAFPQQLDSMRTLQATAGMLPQMRTAAVPQRQYQLQQLMVASQGGGAPAQPVYVLVPQAQQQVAPGLLYYDPRMGQAPGAELLLGQRPQYGLYRPRPAGLPAGLIHPAALGHHVLGAGIPGRPGLGGGLLMHGGGGAMGGVGMDGGAPGVVPPVKGRHSKHRLYKTELCKNWIESGSCRYGAKCQFAHGEAELRPKPAPVAPDTPPEGAEPDASAADGETPTAAEAAMAADGAAADAADAAPAAEGSVAPAAPVEGGNSGEGKAEAAGVPAVGDSPAAPAPAPAAEAPAAKPDAHASAGEQPAAAVVPEAEGPATAPAPQTDG